MKLCVFFLFGAISSTMSSNLGLRATIAIGIFTCLISLLISSLFFYNLYVLFVGYGIFHSIGTSLIYIQSQSILFYNFEKNIGLANGITSFGSSVFTSILPILLHDYIEDYGLSNYLRIEGAVYSTLLLGFIIWHRPKLDKTKCTQKIIQFSKDLSNDINKKKSFISTAKTFILDTPFFQIFKNQKYVVWCCSISLFFMAYSVPYIYTISYAEKVGSKLKPKLLITMLGVGSAIGRIVFAGISDLKRINRLILHQIMLFINAICFILLTLTIQTYLVIPSCIVLGTCSGTIISMGAPICLDLFGKENSHHAYGFTFTIMAIPIFIGPLLSGLILEKTGNYELIYYISAVYIFLASIVVFWATGPSFIQVLYIRVVLDMAVNMINSESKMLSDNENQKLFNIIGERQQTLSTTVVQLFGSNTNINYPVWRKICFGVITFIKDYRRKNYFVRIWNISNERMLKEICFFSTTEYIIVNKYFHKIKQQDGDIFGLNFANEIESNIFGTCAVKKLMNRKKRAEQQEIKGKKEKKEKKKKKIKGNSKFITIDDISAPREFKHVIHLGNDIQSSGNMFQFDDPRIQKLFHMAGITDQQLQDKNSSKVIQTFINNNIPNINTRPAAPTISNNNNYSKPMISSSIAPRNAPPVPPSPPVSYCLPPSNNEQRYQTISRPHSQFNPPTVNRRPLPPRFQPSTQRPPLPTKRLTMSTPPPINPPSVNRMPPSIAIHNNRKPLPTKPLPGPPAVQAQPSGPRSQLLGAIRLGTNLKSSENSRHSSIPELPPENGEDIEDALKNALCKLNADLHVNDSEDSSDDSDW
ncbi:hypothetical protein A3Q56_02868 [Intoshia linei]|uniref:CRIB domain-containing protein n=1 Tax=Intoshia linei TaxID=1819745 RepID=A0A177B6Q9_9BILA|nr:hypothetical protein A3Q56_02868 [Intoshia linei]